MDRVQVEAGTVFVGETPHVGFDLVGHRLIERVIDLHAAVALGERHHADRQRHPPRPGRAAPPGMVGAGGPPPAGWLRPRRTISDDPPPMSNRITPWAAGS